jgi:hypothetical protein
MSMLRRFAPVIGIVFLLLGILGFAPGLSTFDADGEQLLFGVFMVGAFHNAFHVATGVAGLLAARAEQYARWYLRIFGLVYAVLATLGFTSGIARVNTADHILHATAAVVLLGAGFGLKGDAVATSKFIRKEAAQ